MLCNLVPKVSLSRTVYSIIDSVTHNSFFCLGWSLENNQYIYKEDRIHIIKERDKIRSSGLLFAQGICFALINLMKQSSL
jgi:hypothetical protein